MSGKEKSALYDEVARKIEEKRMEAKKGKK